MLPAFPIYKRACTHRGQTAEQLQRRRAWASFATGHSTYIHTHIHIHTHTHTYMREETQQAGGGGWARL